MNFPFFISRKINSRGGESFAATIQRVAVVSIALGVAVMLLSVLILVGFRDTIKEKLFTFSGHIILTKYSLGNSFEEDPISRDREIFNNPSSFKYITHAQEFIHKPGLITKDKEVHGILMKGVGREYDSLRFKESLVAGRFLSFTDSSEVILSRKIAKTMQVDVDEEVLIYILQNPPRFRKLKVVGLYDTGMEDFDDRMIIGDIALARALNGWDDSLTGGFELFVDHFDNIEKAEEHLYDVLDNDLYIATIKDKYIQIFDWLSLLNRNVFIFLSLIMFVACFNMIAILFILIMERRPFIGVLKALGSKDIEIRKIFVLMGVKLTLKGLFYGNMLGMGLCYLQYRFKLIPLDPENYYMSYVPVSWNWPFIIFLNLGVITLIGLVLIIPSAMVSRLSPVEALRRD
ncbi:MAG: ABC transporter permease [Cyclobacteriaceae bacterium]|nr:ABC transporter permease [Cyclobacteriaceae bacterium]MCH8514842.1 ABC transporter permease [Cyclobacteriaceae bacterium]